MERRPHERGQALILIVFAMLGLFGMTGLAVDGGMTYSDRRNAQNAADSAALTGALQLVRGHSNWSSIATSAAATNGYQSDGANTVVVSNPPSKGCNGQVWQPGPTQNDKDPTHFVQVVIHTTVHTYFAPVIGITQTHNCVEAIARALPPINGSPFPGDAIIGLDPNNLSFNDQSNATHWNIKGGGIFANHDALDKHSNVTFVDPGDCVTAVGTATGFTCGGTSNATGQMIQYPSEVQKLLPPIPNCIGKAYQGIDGLMYPDPKATGPKDGSVVNGFDHKFGPGLFCVTNAGGNIHDTVTGTGVTFYVMDTSFTMKYNGGGSFAVSAPEGDPNNPYNGVLMFSNITPTPCTQNVEFRGNGSAPIIGTIFMPSACIDWRGNSTGSLARTQLIGYDVTSNGAGTVAVNYDANDNYKMNLPGEVELTK